jgi:hypothetical protein
MNARFLRHRPLPIGWAILPILALLLTSAGFLAAQATLSAGPLLLHQVRTIYVAPSSDEFVPLVKARLEKWTAVGIASKPEEADAILTCQTESRIVPAKVVVFGPAHSDRRPASWSLGMVLKLLYTGSPRDPSAYQQTTSSSAPSR